jgi:hypothetical protein
MSSDCKNCKLNVNERSIMKVEKCRKVNWRFELCKLCINYKKSEVEVKITNLVFFTPLKIWGFKTNAIMRFRF